ncbi:MAG: hypothetical protein ACLFPQ_05410 [Candidatus Woesearchaeota archaeon]
MSKEIITIPIVMSLVLGLAMQLIEIAESTSEKVVRYAEDMNSAIDCAFRGIDISYCAPNLAGTDFKGELNETKEIIDEINRLNDMLDSINSTEEY